MYKNISENIKTPILALILLHFLIMWTPGCSHPEPNAALTRVAGIVSDDPKTAMVMLDSIDSRKLSDADRHFHDFLTVKARDKAFVTHESDSLIIDVIDYYSSHPQRPIYTEALYYGGRVYTDLGDYPTALQYYQKTLENLDTSSDTTDLKGRLNSQIAMLLETLRLYDKAISYYNVVLNQKLEEQDSAVIVYTLQRLGGIWHEMGEQDRADSILYLSLKYSVSLPDYFSAMSRVLLASVKQEKGDLKAALNLIRNTPKLVEPVSKNTALAHAADIYLAAGIIDTAYIYAHELITRDDMTNKKTGYRILTSSELRKHLHPDTLNQYFSDYKQILEEYFNDNRNELALLQESQYNYRLHERGRLKALKDRDTMRWFTVGFAFLGVILALTVLYIKYRNKSNIIRLHEALDSLDILRHQLSLTLIQGGSNHNVNLTDIETQKTASALRQRLRQELVTLYEASNQQEVSKVILESDVYAKLQNLLKNRKQINDNDVWNELERIVLEASPNFMVNLALLTQHKITNVDREAALLIKCGFRPRDMTILLALSNGGVVSRRESLGYKIFDGKEDSKVITGIIRLL